MIKRVLTGALALGLVCGAAACSGQKKLDKEGSRDALVEGGATEEQATCVVDGLDRELDDGAMDTMLDDGPDALDEEDLRKYVQVFTDCDATALLGGAPPTDTTVSG